MPHQYDAGSNRNKDMAEKFDPIGQTDTFDRTRPIVKTDDRLHTLGNAIEKTYTSCITLCIMVIAPT